MLDAQGSAAHIDVMLAAGLSCFACETVGELAAGVRQHFADLQGCGFMQSLLEVHAPGVSLVRINRRY